MSGQPEIPAVPERDQYGGDELPTYDDLAAQNGPNSRFGRWREWIEKRAAERYADLTPDVLARRRQKGWGDSQDRRSGPIPEGDSATPSGSSADPTPRLYIQTDFGNQAYPIVTPVANKHLPPTPSIGETLSPTHLQLHNFGSRFLPHTTAPIRCLLPILSDRLLLIGHDDGLSVLDMYPKEWNERGLISKGPNDAEVRPIWVGEGVFQMNIVEMHSTGDGIPQGVVLLLVGPDSYSPKEQESVRTIRLYSLSSLISLAKWAVSQKGSKPLNMHHTSSTKPAQGTPKKHQKGHSFAKGLRNLIAESPITTSGSSTSLRPVLSSYSDSPLGLPPSISQNSIYRSTSNDSLSTVDSSWDVVDELPLRWATDYVPLAASRLQNSSVHYYALYRDENSRSRGGAYLAVVMKNNILLYESPKGERAFRFVKEFYTPLQARSLIFVQQLVHDPVSRTLSDASPRPHPHHRHTKHLSVNLGSSVYPPQLSLFVIFDKKAGTIRIADAAVGEVELGDEHNATLLTPLAGSVSGLSRRSRSSWDGKSFHREIKATWTLPVKFTVPGFGREKCLYLLTRGKQSHIFPHPLPASIAVTPAYRTFTWSFTPSYVCPRICKPRDGSPSFLQVIAFGEDGIEVLEVALSSLTENKGKGKEQEPSKAQADVGGDAGFLCMGGHWDRSQQLPLVRSDSTLSTSSEYDEASADRPIVSREEEGIYGWVRRGHEDWRVFWVGGGHER